MSRIFNRILIAFLLLSASLFFLIKEPVLPQRSSASRDADTPLVLPEIRSVSLKSASALARHFPDERLPAEPVEEVIPEQPEAPPEPRYTSEIKYISSVVRGGTRSYYFKNTSTGRMYELVPGETGDLWSLLAEEKDHYLLKKNETIWKVRK